MFPTSCGALCVFAKKPGMFRHSSRKFENILQNKPKYAMIAPNGAAMIHQPAAGSLRADAPVFILPHPSSACFPIPLLHSACRFLRAGILSFAGACPAFFGKRRVQVCPAPFSLFRRFSARARLLEAQRGSAPCFREVAVVMQRDETRPACGQANGWSEFFISLIVLLFLLMALLLLAVIRGWLPF